MARKESLSRSSGGPLIKIAHVEAMRGPCVRPAPPSLWRLLGARRFPQRCTHQNTAFRLLGFSAGLGLPVSGAHRQTLATQTIFPRISAARPKAEYGWQYRWPVRGFQLVYGPAKPGAYTLPQ